MNHVKRADIALKIAALQIIFFFLKFKNNIQTIDVRSLEMPLPMLTILDALDKLPAENALYVYHKRIPVFLLPELSERKFDYRIKEISAGEVHLLIFRK